MLKLRPLKKSNGFPTTYTDPKTPLQIRAAQFEQMSRAHFFGLGGGKFLCVNAFVHVEGGSLVVLRLLAASLSICHRRETIHHPRQTNLLLRLWGERSELKIQGYLGTVWILMYGTDHFPDLFPLCRFLWIWRLTFLRTVDLLHLLLQTWHELRTHLLLPPLGGEAATQNRFPLRNPRSN